MHAVCVGCRCDKFSLGNNETFTDIMAYSCPYTGDDVSYSRQILLFSNPNINNLGTPVGDAAVAYCSLTIGEIAQKIAAWRETCQSPPCRVPINTVANLFDITLGVWTPISILDNDMGDPVTLKCGTNVAAITDNRQH